MKKIMKRILCLIKGHYWQTEGYGLRIIDVLESDSLRQQIFRRNMKVKTRIDKCIRCGERKEEINLE